MVDVSSEKNLGLWGSVLGLVGGFIPYLGTVLSLVGLVLVLVALHGIGKKLNDYRPFNNYLLAVVVGIGVLILGILVVFGVIAISTQGTSYEEYSSGDLTITPGESYETVEYPGWGEFEWGIIIGFLVLVIVMAVINAFFQSRAWGAMHEITGVKEFGDAANWFRWGAFTAVVFVGLLLILIGHIFVILGFNNMPTEINRDETAISPVNSQSTAW